MRTQYDGYLIVIHVDPEGRLRELARGDDHALQALAQMHERNFEASGLDEETYELTRMAALTDRIVSCALGGGVLPSIPGPAGTSGLLRRYGRAATGRGPE